MSDLEDLAEIAEQNAYGFRGLDSNGSPRRPWSETCGAGHLMTEENTRLYRDKRGRIRRVCRQCDRSRATCKRNAKRMRTAPEQS